MLFLSTSVELWEYMSRLTLIGKYTYYTDRRREEWPAVCLTHSGHLYNSPASEAWPQPDAGTTSKQEIVRMLLLIVDALMYFHLGSYWVLCSLHVSRIQYVFCWMYHFVAQDVYVLVHLKHCVNRISLLPRGIRLSQEVSVGLFLNFLHLHISTTWRASCAR